MAFNIKKFFESEPWSQEIFSPIVDPVDFARREHIRSLYHDKKNSVLKNEIKEVRKIIKEKEKQIKILEKKIIFTEQRIKYLKNIEKNYDINKIL